jgi:hypothetical protein
VNNLDDIENVLKEHEAINAHMQTISNLAEDRMLNEWKNSIDLKPEQLKVIVNKWESIKQTFSYLEEGIRLHIDHEERILTDFVGNILAKSINLEHLEIHSQLKELNAFINRNGPQEFLANQDYLNQIISQLCRMIREHEEKENDILTLLRKQFVQK